MRYFLAGVLMAGSATAAQAQRTEENAVTAAQDAFGVSVGTERIGLYNDREVRGFSPVTAGNVRLEGIYLDLQGNLNNRVIEGSSVRVGLSALGYPFPAPTGIVDYNLRMPADDAAVSVVAQLGPFGTFGAEGDGRIPLSGEQLGIAFGASFRRSENSPGQISRFGNLAIVPRWKPNENLEVVTFYGWNRSRSDVEPTVFTAGFFLPPDVGFDYFGQPWADQRNLQATYGGIVRAKIMDSLTIRAGAFRSRRVVFEGYSDLYQNTDSTGLADHVVIASPEQRQASVSGEVRLTNEWRAGDFAHAFHLMGRGRQADSRFGGSTTARLGKAFIGVEDPRPEPSFSFREQSEDAVTQMTGGIGYEGRWAGVGEITLGVQQTRYEKKVDRPGGVSNEVVSAPLLYNVLGAVHLSEKLVAYGGYTKGLEENGTAPDVAANRGEPLPAAITSQREFGLRYAIRPNLRVVAGYFDLRKPYFTLDQRNVFTELGSLKTSGFEFSISGPIAPGLNLVAGLAEMSPQVTGEAVDLGRVGATPVGQTQRLVRVNLNYRPPMWEAISVDAGVVHNGPIAASVRPDPLTGDQLFVPARTVFDVGTRFRFQIARSAAVLRVQLQNLTNEGGWNPTGSGGFRIHEPRRLSASLAVDF